MPIREIQRWMGLMPNAIRKYLRDGAVEPMFGMPRRITVVRGHCSSIAEQHERRRLYRRLSDADRSVAGAAGDCNVMIPA
jgi:predicted site-specific integrase-resolvase